MPAIDDMNLEEIDATMSQLRARKRILKQSGKMAERKIGTLTRRRERLMSQLQSIDEQITALRQGISLPEAPRRRGRRPKSAMITA